MSRMWSQSGNDGRARRHRIPLPLRVRTEWISRNDQPAGLAEDTVMENISQFGCYFLLTTEPTVGSEVEMEITIPVELGRISAGKVYCQGRVLRVEKQATTDRTGVACTIDRFRLVPRIADFQTA